MAKGLHITRSKTRRFRCDIAGCRNFTTIFVSKRGDVSARPLHLCEDCIRTMNVLLDAETIPEADPVEETAVPVEPEPQSEPEPKREPKAESKPNRAKGGKTAQNGKK